MNKTNVDGALAEKGEELAASESRDGEMGSLCDEAFPNYFLNGVMKGRNQMSQYLDFFKPPEREGKLLVENDAFTKERRASIADEFLEYQPYYQCERCKTLVASVGEDRGRIMKKIVKRVTPKKFLVKLEVWCTDCLRKMRLEARKMPEIRTQYLDLMREIKI